tara:strand:- start:1625 stop:2590 length:966 start_codon:yes stop_codon:yes gene_type:complete
MLFLKIILLSIISSNGILYNETYFGYNDFDISNTMTLNLNNSLNKYLGYINYTNYQEPDYHTIEHLSKDIIHNNLHLSNDLNRGIDYRNINNINYVTSVKYQHTCGACVSFAAIAVLEIQYKLKGYTLDLSEKDLFFCKGLRNCDIGWYLYDVSIVLKHKEISEEKYCPYFEYSYMCSDSCHIYSLYAIDEFYYINNFNEMKHWLDRNGTLLTRMNVYRDFFDYNSGIYEKNSDNYIGGHAVAVIGYNDKHSYWICKNSWGRQWGEEGFFRIKYGEAGIMPYAYGYKIHSVPDPYVVNYSPSKYIHIMLYILILFLQIFYI